MKMWIGTLLLAIASAVCTGTAIAAEGFVCVTDHVAGFSYDKARKEWKPDRFKASEKLLITKASKDEATKGAGGS